MENNNSKHTLACMICGILTFCGAVASIISLFRGSNGIWMYTDAVVLFLCAFIGYYAFNGYRKPHGNLLKYIILIVAATYLISIYPMVQMGSVLRTIISSISIGLCCYVAGRLHRVKQNIIIMSVITVLILIGMVDDFVKGFATIGVFTGLIIWIDIFVAYVLRYKEHKEAGLMDAEKK